MYNTHQKPFLSRWSLFAPVVAILACLMLPQLASAKGNPKTVSGDLEILIADDFKNDRADLHHHVKDPATGNRYRLIFKGKPPEGLKNGQKVKIRGNAIGKQITVDELSQEPGVTSGDGVSTGDAAAATIRKAVIVLVDFRDAQHAGGRFADPVALAEQQMYTADRSVNKMYQAASQGQLSFDPDTNGDGAPDVFGPYQIDHDYSDSSCSYYDWSAAAEAAAAADGVDLSLYQHRVFVLPYYNDFTFGCGWAGLANTSCSGSCRAWTAEPQSGMVLAHELGHNLNLAHAGTDPENDGIVNSEYGDRSDPMGSSRNWMVFNAPHTQEMAWFDNTNSQVLDVSSSGTHYLQPLDDIASGVPGLRTLRLNRDSSSSYYASFRRSIGTFSGVGAAYDNVVNIHSHSTADSYERTLFIKSLVVGESFVDATAGFTLTALGDSGNGTAGVEISYSTTCTTADPTISVTPASAVGRDGGEAVQYVVNISNNDSNGCPSTAYNLTTSTASTLNGISSDTVSPGQSWTGYFDLACAADGCTNLDFAAGSNTVIVTADTGGAKSSSDNTVFIRDNTPPTAPGNLAVSINKKGRASVSWTASTDTLSSVAHYQLSVNGGSSIAVTGSSYGYNNAGSGDIVRLVAVDQVGNVSSESTAQAVSSGKGGKPSGGGGGSSKPCRGKQCESL